MSRRLSGSTAVAPGTGPEFPVLDTLRAIGAVAVLTTHAAFQGGEYLRNGVWGTLLARLDVGVAIFFVLSGFLLARPWLARASAGAPRPSPRRYYEKRLLRIYPVYVVTVVVTLLWIEENDGAGVRTWVSSLLLADPYTSQRLPHGLTQMWSLTAEVAFYAVLPLLMWVALGRLNTLRPRRVVGLVLAMGAASAAWILFLADPLQERASGVPGLWLPAFASWFAVGIALALLHVLHVEGRVPSPARPLVDLGRMPGVCWALIGGLMLVAATPLAGPVMFQVGTHGQLLTKNVVYAAIGGLMVLTGMFADRTGAYARTMSARPLRHLGRISYGIFCIHLFVLSGIYAFTKHTIFGGDTLEIWLLTLVLSIVAAEVLYRCIEVPASRISDRWRREESAAITPSAAVHAASTK